MKVSVDDNLRADYDIYTTEKKTMINRSTYQ